MVKQSVENKVEQLILPVIEDLGFELVDIQYTKEGPNWFLRIFIDRPEGIDLDHCEFVSRKVEIILDAKDFKRFAGELIAVNTYAPVNGKKSFEGVLQGLDGRDIVIIIDSTKEMRFPLNAISSVHLAIKF